MYSPWVWRICDDFVKSSDDSTFSRRTCSSSCTSRKETHHFMVTSACCREQCWAVIRGLFRMASVFTKRDLEWMHLKNNDDSDALLLSTNCFIMRVAFHNIKLEGGAAHSISCFHVERFASLNSIMIFQVELSCALDSPNVAMRLLHRIAQLESSDKFHMKCQYNDRKFREYLHNGIFCPRCPFSYATHDQWWNEWKRKKLKKIQREEKHFLALVGRSKRHHNSDSQLNSAEKDLQLRRWLLLTSIPVSETWRRHSVKASEIIIKSAYGNWSIVDCDSA